MKHIFVFLIRVYQKFISRFIPPRCRFYPTCSEYAVTAFRKHGALKGLVLAVWRILRCNPWHHGGLDYVPDTFRLSMKNNHEKNEPF